MSAQALNGSSYTGYNGGTSASNPSGAVPTRDASDITRQLKERLIYNGFNGVGGITPGSPNKLSSVPILNPAGVNHVPGNSEWSWLPYGNQFRLSYLFGKMKNSTLQCTITSFSTPGVLFTVTSNPTALGFVANKTYAVISGGFASKNLGTYLVTGVTSTTITVSNSAGGTDSGSGFIALCPAGLFNGNGPKLPGSSTSTGS